MASPASSDEGEIRDTGLEKANTSLLELDGTSVDRQDRIRSRSSTSNSPPFENGFALRDRRDHDRSHSSYDHGSKGSKRPRDDDHYDRRHVDPRRFRVHYEDRPFDNGRRTRISYEDLDTGSMSSPDLRYDDRDRYPEKRHRTRSRSPYRAPHADDRRARDGYGRKDRGRYGNKNEPEKYSSYGSERQKIRGVTDQSVSKRANDPMPTGASRQDAKSAQGSLQQHSENLNNGTGLER